MSLERLKFIGVLLSVPLAGLIVFQLVMASYGATWLEALRKAYPQAKIEALRAIRLDEVCVERQESDGLNSLCSDWKAVRFLRMAAGVTLAVSILLPISIFFAGRACRANRDLLLRLFKPGLKIALFSVAVLVPIEALLMIGMIWYGESALINRVHGGMILMLGFAALTGAYTVVRIALSSGHSAEASVQGVAVSRDRSPTLWRHVDEWAAAVGTAPPAQIIVGYDPTFFVTEAPVQHAGGKAEGRTLYLSAPMSRLLTMEELRAIVFHELGHFHGADTEFSLRFFPIYRGAADSLAGLGQAAANAGNGGLALIPTLYLLSYFLECFAEAENGISRERELAADAIAARHGGARQAAVGLVKIVAFSEVWSKVTGTFWTYPNAKYVESGYGRYEAKEFLADPVGYFPKIAADAARPEVLNGVDEQRLAHPIDSHPPLSVRLEAWGVSLEDLREEVLAPPPEPATALIDNLAEVEAELGGLLRGSLPEMIIEPPKFATIDDGE